MREALRWGARVLREAGVASPARDALVLLGHAAGVHPEEAALGRPESLERARMERFRELIRARSRRFPVSQLTGIREFWGLVFSVTGEVLTPRPETEHLVELTLARMEEGMRGRVLDLGTGSGCVAVSLAVHRPTWEILAVDLSPSALGVARTNARRHRVEKRVAFLLADLAEPFRERASFDLVVSNPPYIREDEMEGLPPEVRDHEPRLALVGGPKGTEFHERIARQAFTLLKPDGSLLLEVGAGQGETVEGLLRGTGFARTAVHPDLAGIGRVVTGERPHA